LVVEYSNRDAGARMLCGGRPARKHKYQAGLREDFEHACAL